jgi:hypothetical protein
LSSGKCVQTRSVEFAFDLQTMIVTLLALTELRVKFWKCQQPSLWSSTYELNVVSFFLWFLSMESTNQEVLEGVSYFFCLWIKLFGRQRFSLTCKYCIHSFCCRFFYSGYSIHCSYGADFFLCIQEKGIEIHVGLFLFFLSDKWKRVGEWFVS